MEVDLEGHSISQYLTYAACFVILEGSTPESLMDVVYYPLKQIEQ